MKLTAILLAITLSVAAALPVEDVAIKTDVNTRNSALEELVLGIIEEFRQTMIDGSDDIPVLDPLVIEHLQLDLDDLGLENSRISVGGVEARQLSTFVIDDLSLVSTNLLLQRFRLEVEGHIPVIEIDAAEYDLSANALGMHIFGEGSAKLRIIEPRIKATIEVGLGILGGISITIRSANVVLELAAFESEITGIFGNPVIEDFINAFLGNLLPEMVEFFQEEISEVINSIIMGIGSIDLSSSALAKDVAVRLSLPQLENQENYLPPVNA